MNADTIQAQAETQETQEEEVTYAVVRSYYPQTVGFSIGKEITRDGDEVVVFEVHSRTKIDGYEVHHIGPEQTIQVVLK